MCPDLTRPNDLLVRTLDGLSDFQVTRTLFPRSVACLMDCMAEGSWGTPLFILRNAYHVRAEGASRGGFEVHPVGSETRHMA